MKKILSDIIFIFLPLSFTNSQQSNFSFGSDHSPTPAISSKQDGKLMLFGGYSKFYDLPSGKEYLTIQK